jgi:hypothetical protein
MFVAIVFVALASCGGASAASRHYRRPASAVAEVELRGAHGFELRLVAFDHSMDLSVTKGVTLGEEGVTYSSRRPTVSTGYFNGSSLDVRVGRLGRFLAHFVPTSTKSEGDNGECRGNPPTIEQGHFVGSLDFRGERGYTSAHTHRALGTVTRIASARCVVRSPRFRPGDEFRLVAGDKKADTILQASREEVSSGSKVTPTSFLASVASKSGNLAVVHSAFVLDFHAHPGATFRTPNLAEPLAEATLQPPAPFSGSAIFRLEGMRRATWTGDLTVELPGLGRVPLVNDGVQAGLCQGRSNCTETLPPRLAQIFERKTGFGARSGTISIVGTRSARDAAGI